MQGESKFKERMANADRVIALLSRKVKPTPLVNAAKVQLANDYVGPERKPGEEAIPPGYAAKPSCRRCYGRGYQYEGVRCKCVGVKR